MNPRTEVHISKDALISNYKLLSELASGELWPVIKSNAYGHGAREVVLCIDHLDFSHYIVQNRHEAEELFDLTDKQFLMLGTQNLDQYKNLSTRIIPVIPSLEVLGYLENEAHTGDVHIMINTGMNREGIEQEEVALCLDRLAVSSMSLVGVMTHFASADERDLSSMKSQEKIFQNILTSHPQLSNTQYIHANNSAGIVTSTLPGCNLSRAGITLYGLSPFTEIKSVLQDLKPVLSFHSFITQIRDIKAGDTVGYGDTFIAPEDMKVATVPVGYYEGLPRSLSDIGEILIAEQYARIIGRVSMNMISVDVTGITCKVNDRVTIISSEKSNPQAPTFAFIDKTIPYEITTNIKSHIPRIII